MYRIVTIDQGNTRIKLSAYTPDGQMLYAASGERLTTEMLAEVCADDTILATAWCATGTVPAADEKLIYESFGSRLLKLTPETPVPVKVDYGTPGTLGADRIALACGAASLYPGQTLLIADAGTALTLDVLDAEGYFRGGNISPGAAMRLEALHAYTSRLPKIVIDPTVSRIGHDTSEAMRAGAVYGILSEIKDTWNYVRGQLHGQALILTGGDSAWISSLLTETPHVVREDLLQQGLISILKHNDYI